MIRFLKVFAVAGLMAAAALPGQGQTKRTDVNGDRVTDVDDLNMVVNEMLGKSALRYATDFLQVTNATAHYVGNSLIVDFDVTNVSSIDIYNATLRIDGLTTDGGSQLSTYNGISAGEGQVFVNQRVSNYVIDRGETRQMRIRMTDNALTVVPGKVTVKIYAYMEQVGNLDVNFLTFVVPVTDEREHSNAIWTNDDHLAYSLAAIERDGNDLLATFSVTNDTGRDLNNVMMRFDLVNNGSGNTFSTYSSYFVVEGNKSPQRLSNFTLDRGETRQMTMLISDFFKTTPRALNATIHAECDNYTFASTDIFVTGVKIPDEIK